MSLAELLQVRPGITAVIGGGGKTTLLRKLGEELSQRHRVLLCTTTKMLPYSDVPFAGTAEEVKRLRETHRLLCAGTELPDTGKFTAPSLPMEQLAGWFDYVLVEADGAARRPLKAHAAHEPVIPAAANQTICVVGASGFGRSIQEAAHRPGLYAQLAGVSVEAPVTPDIVNKVLRMETLHNIIYVNQVDVLQNLDGIFRLAQLSNTPVLAGSLWKGEYVSCWL